MGDIAKVIALDDIRASQKHQALRQQLHERFDQWLDALEHQLPEAELTLQQVSETRLQKHSKRLTTAGYILMTIGAGLTMASFAAGAIRWGVAAWNRRTNSSAMSV
jgi:predicted acetyltransferase